MGWFDKKDKSNDSDGIEDKTVKPADKAAKPIIGVIIEPADGSNPLVRYFVRTFEYKDGQVVKMLNSWEAFNLREAKDRFKRVVIKEGVYPVIG